MGVVAGGLACPWDNAAVPDPRRHLRGASVIAILWLLALVAGGCSDDSAPAPAAEHDDIIVGAFAFTESLVVAELYAQALEANGFPVRRTPGLGSREVVEPALEQGAIDVLPEYVGTALQFLRGGTEVGDGLADTNTAVARLNEAFAPRGVSVLAPAEAQDKNGVAVTRATADRLGLARISDLAPVAADLVLGGPPECPERPFCLIGLQSAYGLSFKDFLPLDASGPKTVGALEGGEVDVAILFTTAPSLGTKDFVLLDDDRRLQPAENVVPVVRTDALRRNGDRLAAVLDSVSAQLGTDDLVALNGQVDEEGVAPADAAREWLAARGLGPR